jgi:DNA adenine methylase
MSSARKPAVRYPSPLRYPGGKGKLAGFFKEIFRLNRLIDGEYAEPYAGGASIALALLFSEHARRVHINDLDRSVYAFWHSALKRTSDFTRFVLSVPLTVAEWERQREVQASKARAPLFELGCSTFFLNRTNRSGIVTGGLIGGIVQDSEWGIDARFNREELVQRVERVSRYRDRISLTQLDAMRFLDDVVAHLPTKSLTYLDPPYFIQGQRLYARYYDTDDHEAISKRVARLRTPWVVSYDAAPEIQRLYGTHPNLIYGLSYSAADHYRGAEAMFFSDSLSVPKTTDPATVGKTPRR